MIPGARGSEESWPELLDSASPTHTGTLPLGVQPGGEQGLFCPRSSPQASPWAWESLPIQGQLQGGLGVEFCAMEALVQQGKLEIRRVYGQT